MTTLLHLLVEDANGPKPLDFARSDDDLSIQYCTFSLCLQPEAPGPELISCSPMQYKLTIPDKWQLLREKELAALRRTISSAALEIIQELKPAMIFTSHISLCGIAGAMLSKALNCPLVLELTQEDVEIGMFDASMLPILDFCLKAAHAVIVSSTNASIVLSATYPHLAKNSYFFNSREELHLSLQGIIKKCIKANTSVPWIRHGDNRMPVSRPVMVGPEIEYIEEVLHSGWWGYGPVATFLEDLFIRWCGSEFHSLAVSSCTAALHLSLLALDIKEGDEVIVPALTFTATAEAVIHAGAIPRFADVDQQTLCITPDSINNLVTHRTRAVIPVHFAGVPIDMDSLRNSLNTDSFTIIEDAAHALGAECHGRHIGSQSAFTCFSFAPTKHAPSCAGGVLVFRDASIAGRLRELSNLGLKVDTLQRSIQNGSVNGNEVMRKGYRYRMDDVSAAIAVAQFQRLEETLSYRTELVRRYYFNLSAIPECQVLEIPEYVKPSWYILPIRVPVSQRDRLRGFLASRGIDTSIHYPVLTEQPAFSGLAKTTPVASNESRRLISLPLFSQMTYSDVDRVCEAIAHFFSETHFRG